MHTCREKAIVGRIMRYLNTTPQCVARKRWGTAFGVAGDPDISGCIRGRHFELEVKRPGEHPTPLQAKRLEQWQSAGAITAAVTSVDEVKALFRLHEVSGL
jgi:hypothetical protein